MLRADSQPMFPMTLHRLEPCVGRLLRVETEDCKFESVLKAVTCDPYPRAEFYNGVTVAITDDNYGVWHVAYPRSANSPIDKIWVGAEFEDVEDPGSERWRWMEQRHPGDIIRWAKEHIGLGSSVDETDPNRKILNDALRAASKCATQPIDGQGLVHVTEVGR